MEGAFGNEGALPLSCLSKLGRSGSKVGCVSLQSTAAWMVWPKQRGPA
jgi:hypothetical protein